MRDGGREVDGNFDLTGATVEVVDVTGRVREGHPPPTSTLRPVHGAGDPLSDTPSARWRRIARRQHPIYRSRVDQLRINLLALDGGRPYVEARLSRFAGESAIDWEGGNRADGTPVTGRLEQAHCIPYPGRIAEKISQYVFAQDASREGAGGKKASADFLKDVTRNGESVALFMHDLNNIITACGWCWIGVDSPEYDAARTNLQQKEQRKLRPYWTLYRPTEVVDWKIRDDGFIEWLLTETVDYDAGDPFEESEEVRVRDLWEPGKRTRFTFKGSRVKSEEEFKFALDRVPFVLVGRLSARPHLFDSIESINRTIMDLESCSRQNFFDRVFPQMYLPAAAVSNAMRVYNVSESAACEMIVGMSYTILLDKDDVTPGYITPNTGDLSAVDDKAAKLKGDMFECVGLMLRQESRAAQSGEAKAWDHLDAEAVLAERSRLLEDAERDAAKLTAAFDSTVPLWDPQYPKSFDVSDFGANIAAIVQGSQVSQPPELARLGLRVIYQMYKKLNRIELTDEEEKEVLDAIAEFDTAGDKGGMEDIAGSGAPNPFGKGGGAEPEPTPEERAVADKVAKGLPLTAAEAKIKAGMDAAAAERKKARDEEE